tara:strand:- start:10161 stop:11303 length:1143 start_codon:yes stop_codon:yes gene_type:complete
MSNQSYFLNDEQKMIRDTARDFAHNELSPYASSWDEGEEFPTEIYSKMGSLGLMGMLVSEEWGGSGADHVSYALALEEIAAGDVGASTGMSVNNSLVCTGIEAFGSDFQKTEILTPLVRGEALGCFCLTEPQAGSDAASVKTKAVLDGNSWVLNGTKQFITNGSKADFALVFAVTDPDAGKKGISCFIIPTEKKGYNVSRIEKKMGQRGHDTAQITFEDLRVEPEMILGDLGHGYKIALSNLEGGRIGVAAQALGAARAAYECALDYSKDRETFGKPIIQHQAVGFRLADMATEIEAARLLIHNSAKMRDSGIPCIKEASMAKLYSAEMAERVCSSAIQTLGGYGYLSDFPVERIYRDMRVCSIYEGTGDVQRMVIARTL